jgi:hypothetical protein
MSVESEFRDLLAGDGGVSALVGSGSTARVYPLVAPEGAARPLVVYQGISADVVPDEDNGRYVFQRFQVSCLAESYAEMKALAEAVKSALAGYAGGLIGSPLSASKIQAIFWLDQAEMFDYESQELRRDLDFQVQSAE